MKINRLKGMDYMQKNKYYLRKFCTIVVAAVFMLQLGNGFAQPLPPNTQPPPPNDQQELRERNQQIARERQTKQEQTDVFLNKAENKEETLELPEEEVSFTITEIKLLGEKSEKFHWVQELLQKYQGRKIGKEGINILVKQASNAIIAKGYVTTRITIPEQDISKGVLTLELIPGFVEQIVFEDPKATARWDNALPIKPGDLLNIRDIEQGLEQFKRVPSQDADIKIRPGKKIGQSDIVITMKRDKPWRLTLSTDDSGSEATGKIQMSTNLSIDNLFNDNDLFYASINNDLVHQGNKKGTDGKSIYYSIPYGYWTLSVGASQNDYHQTITQYNQSFKYSGENENVNFKVQKIIERSQTSKTQLSWAINKKISRSYIEDTEFTNQRKEVTSSTLGLYHRQYYGKTVLDYEVDYQWAVPWFNSVLTENAAKDEPTTKYRIWTVDTTLTTPMKFGNSQGSYSLNIRGQYTNNTLFTTDQFSIGNRYTVRGFDGEETLTAEKGIYLRNEFSVPVAQKQEMYIGIDYGHVAGPSAQGLVGKTLIGSAVGFRGSLGKASYDVFTGWPIKKPTGFKTANQVFGFQINYQY
jgi:hemolysin activation/secretion protein